VSDSELERDDFDRDDELRALLRGGDPAGALPPADPAALVHLLEDIMSADLEIRPTQPDAGDEGSRATGTHGRNRLTWLVAAAAAAVIAGVGGFAISGLSGDSAPPQAGPNTTTPDTSVNAPLAGQTTDLTATAPRVRCAPVSAAILVQYDQAFQGTVTAIDGDTVTLHTTEVFAGEVGETVQVTAAPAGLRAMIQQVKFEVGGTYLVSASAGSVGMCGFSGQATGELRSLYTKAFVR
jgi:hypothetical protein